jgi:hypothetical protein
MPHKALVLSTKARWLLLHDTNMNFNSMPQPLQGSQARFANANYYAFLAAQLGRQLLLRASLLAENV